MQAQTDEVIIGPLVVPEVTRLLYGRRDAAQALSISVRKLDYLIQDGRLKAKRLDGRVLIHIDELRRFAQKL